MEGIGFRVSCWYMIACMRFDYLHALSLHGHSLIPSKCGLQPRGLLLGVLLGCWTSHNLSPLPDLPHSVGTIWALSEHSCCRPLVWALMLSAPSVSTDAVGPFLVHDKRPFVMCPLSCALSCVPVLALCLVRTRVACGLCMYTEWTGKVQGHGEDH